jgi:hypothetical protein
MQALTLLETHVEDLFTDNLNSVIEQDANLIQAIDNIMLESTRSQVTLLQDASWHIIKSGGKRVRPRMLLLSCLRRNRLENCYGCCCRDRIGTYCQRRA